MYKYLFRNMTTWPYSWLHAHTLLTVVSNACVHLIQESPGEKHDSSQHKILHWRHTIAFMRKEDYAELRNRTGKLAETETKRASNSWQQTGACKATELFWPTRSGFGETGFLVCRIQCGGWGGPLISAFAIPWHWVPHQPIRTPWRLSIRLCECSLHPWT